MNTFADAFDLPITLNVDGKEYSVAPLSSEDYIPWCEEMTTLWRERRKSLIPPGVKPLEKYDILVDIELREITPDDIYPQIFTPKGSLKMIHTALKKAGVSEEAAKKFTTSHSAKTNERMASRLSGLMSETRYAQIYSLPPKPGTVPNPPAAESAASEKVSE